MPSYKTMTEKIETSSHSEEKILQGCISLMQNMFDNFLEYLEFIGVDIDELPEEEQPCYNISYMEIVRKLFLWNTRHSGGTSTMQKCRELGVDSGETLCFEYEKEDE